MQKTAIVKSLDCPDIKRKNAVIVETVSSLKCVSCSQACSKKESNIAAINSRNLPLKVNSVVTISTSRKQSTFEGLFSVLFPIAMAIAGFFLSNPVFKFIQLMLKKGDVSDIACPEGFKALLVLVFFFIASLCVLLVTRSNVLLVYPEITDVLEPER